MATVNLESLLSSDSKNTSRSLRSSGLGVLNVRVEPWAVCSWIWDAFDGPLLIYRIVRNVRCKNSFLSPGDVDDFGER